MSGPERDDAGGVSPPPAVEHGAPPVEGSPALILPGLSNARGAALLQAFIILATVIDDTAGPAPLDG